MSRWKTRSRVVRKWKNKLIQRDGMRCAWCGVTTWQVARPKGQPRHNRLTIDHVIPRNGTYGINVLDNFLAACARCNGKRGNLSVEEFIPLAPDPQMDLIRAATERVKCIELP